MDGSGTAPRSRTGWPRWTEPSRRTNSQRLVVAGQHDYETTANWKILTENYHECYHCPAIHPELCKVSPPKSGENYSAPGIWVGGWMDLRDGMATMSLDGASHGVLRCAGWTRRGCGRSSISTSSPTCCSACIPTT